MIDIIQLHYLEQLYACLKSLILSLFFKHIIIDKMIKKPKQSEKDGMHYTMLACIIFTYHYLIKIISLDDLTKEQELTN